MNGFSPIDIAITSTYKDKGARQAQNSLTKLSKSANTLARNFGVAFSIAQLVRFGKASVSAYAAEQKSAKSLALTLGNLGQSFAVIDTEAFIAKIQKTRGVLDDQLRPAMATLVSTTLDAKKSQDILLTALDLSAGAGVDLETATNALAKSYLGNNSALGKLNIGLTQSEIKTASFTEIQTQLNKQFAGQGEASASSFAGQMAIVAASADVAKEIIGKGLVDAMADLNVNANNTGGAMEFLAKQIASVTTGAAKFIRGNVQLLNTPISELLSDKSGSVFGYKMNFKTPYDPMSAKFDYEATRKKEKQLQADAAKAAKARLAAIAKERQLLIDQGKIKKSQTLLDIDQIQIVAALAGKITDNERTRLELQLALLQGNASEADRLGRKLFESQMLTSDLAEFLKNLPEALNPFAKWAQYAEEAKKTIQTVTSSLGASVVRALGVDPSQISPNGTITGSPLPDNPTIPLPTNQMDFSTLGNAARDLFTGFGQTSTNINYVYNINGATSSLMNELRNGFIDSSASGSFSTINSPAG
jgi:hypothetical protein